MKRLFETAHDLIRDVLRPGDIAIDATAGNGHDTLSLATGVGPAGHVFAFDIQSDAIAATRQRLAAAGVSHLTLFQHSHADLFDLIPTEHHGRIVAILFNLGYRPGGDRAVTTQLESTITALTAAFQLLKPGGILTVIAYRDHFGGADELNAVEAWMQDRATVETFESELPHGPRLFVMHKPAEPRRETD